MVLTLSMRRIALRCLVAAGLILARTDAVRYLRWPEVQPLFPGLAATGEKLPEITDAADWDSWIREHDGVIRGRIDRGIEDSISALIVFGTSFPSPPRLANAADAVNAAGDLTANARARVNAFIQAIDQLDNERFRVVLEFLRHRRVSAEEVAAFLSGNLRRWALEQASFQKKHSPVTATSEAVSSETSLLINFAIEDTLRALKATGGIPAHIRRIAVIGPGLDLAGEPIVFDHCPLQSIQPFAVLDTVLRLGLAQASEVQITAVDVNPFVLSHLRTSLTKARGGQRYVLQVARPTSAGWSAAAVSYWQHFGETIGTPAAPANASPGMELRTVAVKPQIASRVTVDEVDIITQALETAPGQGFDLVVATNLFAYYSRLEQQLGLANLARLMAPGGTLLSNGLAVKPSDFEDLGGRDDLVIYRRR